MSGSTNNGGEMSNTQLFHQMAFLNWLWTQSDKDKQTLMALTGIQVARELMNRLTGQGKIDEYKTECIQSIADFVQRNPRASQLEINTEVEKHVLLFAARVKALDSASIL